MSPRLLDLFCCAGGAGHVYIGESMRAHERCAEGGHDA